MQETGPYENYPMQVDSVARIARSASDAYIKAMQRLTDPDLAQLADENYGRLSTYIMDRAPIADSLAYAAEEYLDSQRDYDRLYYFWAAYAALLERSISGCGDYLD